MRRCALLFAMFVAIAARANELTVDRTAISIDDTLTITVALEGGFTSADSLEIPLQNLKLLGSPSVSTQISFVNGTLTQRKVFRYTARPVAAGAALVGPLVVEGRDGQRETLSPVSVQVLPDLAAGTNDAARIFAELMASHRDPLFVTAEVDRGTATVGEEVVVTWTLYNGASVEQWDIGNVPKLEDFWSEELDVRNERPQTVMIGQYALQKLIIRRVALFPLHAGTVNVGPLEVRAEIMRRVDVGSPFGSYEGSVVDISRRSAPVSVDVQPVPAGAPIDVVGDVALTCGKATQANGGPVVRDVALSGRANLRTAAPPHWASRLDGSTQVEAGQLVVARNADAATMTRRWKLMVFPAHDGRFALPGVMVRAFSPSAGRQELRCEGVTLDVRRAEEIVSSKRSAPAARPGPSTTLGVTVGVVSALLVVLIVPRVRRASAIRKKAREMARPVEETRDKLHALLASKTLDDAVLMREASDRGDAYRGVRSLLDSIDRERLEIDDPQSEVEFRMRDFLQFLM